MISLLTLFILFIPAALQAQEALEGDWSRFPLTGSAMGIEWSASSVLEAGNFWETSRYGPEKALDGNPATAWVEGAPKGGIGESYVIALEHCPSALGFINGYAENRSLFEKNYRIKELTVKI